MIEVQRVIYQFGDRKLLSHDKKILHSSPQYQVKIRDVILHWSMDGLLIFLS